MATLNLNEKKIPSAENLRLIAQLCISLANKQSSLEDRCIAPWKSGEVYQKDISYVSHDGYIYLCSVSNNDTDFTESHWTKLSDTISELTKANIEALVNLTPEQITNLQSLIDDTSINTTHTNSSSHIYMAIQDAIAECKDDTLKQIAKKVSGSYKIANTTADIVSADYIYLLSNGSNYDLYVLVDGTAKKVGDTNIDLSEYAKTTDLADYMKTSDADGKFATITAVDGKADKSKIPTTLPANGGNADTVNNHTVKSDVPENAVFTDTIYDDTEMKAEISKNGTPVGCIFPFAGINLPVGYLLCNGASYKVADYPDLYAVIGNTYGGDSTNFNVPDYRETVLVGVGENTTDTIASHDVYELGEFKDDQLQRITGDFESGNRNTQPRTNGAFSTKESQYTWFALSETATTSSRVGFDSSTVTRSGTTTHGKQKGVTYIIKAR